MISTLKQFVLHMALCVAHRILSALDALRLSPGLIQLTYSPITRHFVGITPLATFSSGLHTDLSAVHEPMSHT